MILAIEGGSPVRTHSYPAWPQYDESEEQALMRALHQGTWWRATGKENTLFEQEFAHYHGASHAVTVSNGTCALEIALQVCGVLPGDEVIVPAFTFISTSMAVQRVGAVPVAVDVLADTYCMDPLAFEKAITDKTKAVIPVHMCGHFCDMKAIMGIAEQHNLMVIQDAAHAHGARGQMGRAVGEWGTIACFSFQNFKLMSAGEGGLILCPDEEIRERAFLYSNCGRPADDRDYQHLVVGVNARLSEFSAALLRSQLDRLETQTIVRERNARLLSDALEDVPEVKPQKHTQDAVVHPHYMYMFTLSDEHLGAVDRKYFVDCLIAEGIPAFIAYRAIYRVPNFSLSPCSAVSQSEYIRNCPVTEHISARGIWIHHRALLGSGEDALDVARAIRKVIDALR